MKRLVSLMVLALFAAALLTNCGKKKSSPPAVPPTVTIGTLISSPTPNPITAFAQTLVNHDTDDNGNGWVSTFPGQTNVWDIRPDFNLNDGSDDQFDGALVLKVGATYFPNTQTFGELTFYTPTVGSGDGVKVAAVSDGESTGYSAITGTYSAFLNSTSDSRIMQTLNLAGATGTITLTWDQDVSLFPGTFTGYTPGFRVVVRNAAGAELEELYATAADQVGAHSANLTAYSGQSIVLSFEHHSAAQGWNPRMAIIDNVSVLDSAGTPVEYVTNGTFETGSMTGWTANTPQEVQNMTSGVRTLEGLDVKRSFYTVPNKLWGRWVDVFSNPTMSDITKTVTYETNLGSDYFGIIYGTPDAGGKSLTSWDGNGYDRDIALVHGLVSSETYTSDPTLGSGGGNDDVSFTYDITVPAGGSVAIVNFIVMGSYDTGLTAVDVTATATEVDEAAKAIVDDFWDDVQYRHGMTQAQIDAVSNF